MGAFIAAYTGNEGRNCGLSDSKASVGGMSHAETVCVWILEALQPPLAEVCCPAASAYCGVSIFRTFIA